jgi:lipopolysaccharide/colanic/teichoic acid biosynthesis glycosyltransferase
MNNSKSSVVASSKSRFTAPQAHSSWSSRNNVGHRDIRILEVDRVEEVAEKNSRGARETEDRPRSEVKQLDLGLWLLLYGSSDRHDRWEELKSLPGREAESRKNCLQYSSSLIKRGCDVIGSFVLLIVLFPVFVIVAVLIKMDSPGPVFFRHYRIGRDGNPFVLWKFRSMKTDVLAYEASPRTGVDSRLTRVGRIIRRLSLDEIPQLINVLKGEMSLVGPRPEMPFIVARYHSTECERLTARPGITGLWQISPARAFPIHENLQYDLHYVRNQNFFLDCAIVFRTIAAVIRGVGAV